MVLLTERDQDPYQQNQETDEYGNPKPAEEEKSEGLLGYLKSLFGRGKSSQEDKPSGEHQIVGSPGLTWNLVKKWSGKARQKTSRDI